MENRETVLLVSRSSLGARETQNAKDCNWFCYKYISWFFTLHNIMGKYGSYVLGAVSVGVFNFFVQLSRFDAIQSSRSPSRVQFSILWNFESRLSIFGGEVSWRPTPKDIQVPSHSRNFREKLWSAYMVMGVRNLLTDLLFNRLSRFPHEKILEMLEN